MNRITALSESYGEYVRALLGSRIAELRQKVSQNDVGASAIELAIITALIAVVAAGVATIIVTVVTSKESTISGL